MDIKMGQMLKNSQRVGQKVIGHQKVGSKYQGKQSGYKTTQGPDPVQLKETTEEYHKYK